MGRLKDLDAEMHELPDSEKEIQEALDKTKNMRAYVLGFELGQEAERDRILSILYNKGLELEKDVSLDDEASRTRYLFMLDIIEIVKNSGE